MNPKQAIACLADYVEEISPCGDFECEIAIQAMLQAITDLAAAREDAKDYATQLDTATEIIQQVHPVAAERGLGRLEVAAALRDIADDLAAARRELARFQWQPIESAPKTNHAYLVYCPRYKNTFAVCWDEASKWWVLSGTSFHGVIERPSHWMYLPEPPTNA